MRWGAVRLVVLPAVLAAAPLAAQASAPASAPVTSGALVATVTEHPFRLTVRQGDTIVLETTGPHPFAAHTGGEVAVQTPLAGYGVLVGAPLVTSATTTAAPTGPGRWHLSGALPTGSGTLTVAPAGDGVLRIRYEPDDPSLITSTSATFARASGERFLGFGERSEGADQTGNLVEVYAEEGPFDAGAFRPVTDPLLGEDWQGPSTVNRATNYPLPWFVSSAGYGLLADTDWPAEFDLRAADHWAVRTREPALEVAVVAGPTPAEVVSRYTSLVGRQPRPAEWFFGPWYQPAGSSAERETVRLGWRRWDVPVTVAQTYAHYLPCAAHDGRRQALRDEVGRYHSAGYKITTYVNSFVCNDHPQGAYETGDANGWFVKTALGTTYPVPYAAYLDSPWSAIVDFTDPDAVAFWQGLVSQALDDGYDGWMEDFGEYVPPDAVMSDGRSGLAVHNEYCDLYHRASHELTAPIRGADFAQFVRCGGIDTAASARIVWGGDPSEDDSEADGLAAALNQGLSMGLSGVAYWGSDISGFHALFHLQRVSVDVFARWIELGAVSGIMRTQGNGYGNPLLDQGARPREWGDELLPIWRRYAKLRTQLFPYVWAASERYQADGIPIMRHLALAYPASPEAWDPATRHELLFGPDLLVAPVVDEGARARAVWLPPGDWVEFWAATTYDDATGELVAAPAPVIAGDRWITVDAPLDELPMFVRAGACLPVLPADVDTLADLDAELDPALADDVVTLAEAGPNRTLDYGGCGG